MKPYFYDLGCEEWEQWVRAQGLPAYRAGQLFRWTGRGVSDWAQLTDQPAAIRELLAACFDIDGLTAVGRFESELDQTVKTV